MYAPRMRTLETSAQAARSAFGFDEADYATVYVRPARPGRMAMLMLALGGGSFAIAHHFGLTTLLASISGWRGAA